MTNLTKYFDELARRRAMEIKSERGVAKKTPQASGGGEVSQAQRVQSKKEQDGRKGPGK